MTEVDDKSTTFEFDSYWDKQQVMDISPWSIQGPSLNLNECTTNTCLEDIDFDVMQMWIQISGLSLEMFNGENARRIGESLGRCVNVEMEHILQQRSLIRLQIEIDITRSLQNRLWWIDAQETG